MVSKIHVVFGAGQVGPVLARMLLDTGHRVRVVRQSAGSVVDHAEVVRGDAADPAFCDRACRNAAVVYHCMNPPYSTKAWTSLVPRFMENLIAAAGRADARLVVLDNVYMLGRPGGLPFDEDTPPNPCSRKGEIRARAAQALLDSHKRGDVRAVIGRASDFYGPGGTLTHLGDQFWPSALAGKKARVLIDPDSVHTYHYIPDVARGLATLSAAPDDAFGKPWMLPCAPAGTLRELVARIDTESRIDIRLGSMPRPILRALGVFIPILREVGEMLYQWDEPFVIDDSRFRTQFGTEPTDVDEAARETATWALGHYKA